MEKTYTGFDEDAILHELKHYLPAQAPLKDFIHHNTLHAFQNLKFEKAIRIASEIFGYRVSLSIEEFRKLYQTDRINKDVLREIVRRRKGTEATELWLHKLLQEKQENPPSPRIGVLRSHWRKKYKVDLDSLVHPTLFRILCSYLDQGISIWNFPVRDRGFLESIKALEEKSFTSFFRHKPTRKRFLTDEWNLQALLNELLGDEKLFKQYLFDLQFAHQGWSGMVSAIEDHPETLLDQRLITLKELIIFELYLEMDILNYAVGDKWAPLAECLAAEPIDLFAPVANTELNELLGLWQEAFEWSYYEQVLTGIQKTVSVPVEPTQTTFQAMFCIDDRECSIRRYLERFDPNCVTFGTPGFFGVEFYYQPEEGKFYTKLCPAPVNPKYLIKETGSSERRETDPHLSKHSHTLHSGWLISQTLGFWSAFRLFLNIFRPSVGPATASSFRHMDQFAQLTIENEGSDHVENGLQVGFNISEMAIRVENLLRSIGLVKDFAPIVYVVGHGSSSVNNPHYAAYDCGACSGRAGSVNSRVICHMANHPAVRAILGSKGIDIPDETQFIGALHDTTRDEIMYFDEDQLHEENRQFHIRNQAVFVKALDYNAKERSRRFVSIDTTLSPEKIHEKIRLRSVSLFEPRPELNHATNALCIVGRRELSKSLFLDRRSFMNSFDYRVDPEGKYLLNILKACAPVCGGINLEYLFSRVDNQKLGAGTKLPHNVMGLFGVANGIDGDLRPGLPSQMIEVHDPVRLLIIVEHYPEVVLKTIQVAPETYEWFINNWVNLVAVHPETRELFRFADGEFLPYNSTIQSIPSVENIDALLETSEENFPVYLIK